MPGLHDFTEQHIASHETCDSQQAGVRCFEYGSYQGITARIITSSQRVVNDFTEDSDQCLT
ncbi:hypothetical protein D3C87_1206910 [compost metagenome]